MATTCIDVRVRVSYLSGIRQQCPDSEVTKLFQGMFFLKTDFLYIIVLDRRPGGSVSEHILHSGIKEAIGKTNS